MDVIINVCVSLICSSAMNAAVFLLLCALAAGTLAYDSYQTKIIIPPYYQKNVAGYGLVGLGYGRTALGSVYGGYGLSNYGSAGLYGGGAYGGGAYGGYSYSKGFY